MRAFEGAIESYYDVNIASWHLDQPIYWPAGGYYRVGGTRTVALRGLGTRKERHVETPSLHGQPIGSQRMAACRK